MRILLADDYDVVRTELKAIIAKQEGWSVCGEAANGAEAISKVLELQPDAIVLDIRMPILNGIEAAAEIRKLAPTTKILILSSYDESVLAVMVPHPGADAYLSKERSNEKLIEILTALGNGGKDKTYTAAPQ